MANKTLPSAQDIAAKQIQNVSASTAAYRAGISRVTVAPGAQAAAKQDKYLNGVQANVAKWASNVAKVTLQQWSAAALDKGAQRLGTGIAAARDKITAFWSDFLPFLSNVQGQVAAMPSDTFEQRIQKMVSNAQMIHAFRRRA